MKLTFCLHLSLISFLFLLTLQLQAQTRTVKNEPPQLSFQNVQRNGSVLEISFQINYQGVVELRLFKDERLIYHDQKVYSDGIHQYRLNADKIVQKLGSGSYLIELKYKGETYTKSVSL